MGLTTLSRQADSAYPSGSGVPGDTGKAQLGAHSVLTRKSAASSRYVKPSGSFRFDSVGTKCSSTRSISRSWTRTISMSGSGSDDLLKPWSITQGISGSLLVCTCPTRPGAGRPVRNTAATSWHPSGASSRDSGRPTFAVASRARVGAACGRRGLPRARRRGVAGVLPAVGARGGLPRAAHAVDVFGRSGARVKVRTWRGGWIPRVAAPCPLGRAPRLLLHTPAGQRSRLVRGREHARRSQFASFDGASAWSRGGPQTGARPRRDYRRRPVT